MKFNASKLLKELKASKVREEKQKKGGKGGSNFLNGLVDIPTIMNLTSKIQCFGIVLSGNAQNLVKYARLLINSRSSVNVVSLNNSLTILDSTEFISKRERSVKKNGSFVKEYVSETKGLSFKTCFALKSNLEFCFKLSRSKFRFLSLSRSKESINMSFFYEINNITRFINYDLDEMKMLFVLSLLDDIDCPESLCYFGDEIERKLMEMTCLYVNRNQYDSLFELQKETARHSTFRQSIDTDMIKFLYTGGTIKNNSSGTFNLEESKKQEKSKPIEENKALKADFKEEKDVRNQEKIKVIEEKIINFEKKISDDQKLTEKKIKKVQDQLNRTLSPYLRAKQRLKKKKRMRLKILKNPMTTKLVNLKDQEILIVLLKNYLIQC